MTAFSGIVVYLEYPKEIERDRFDQTNGHLVAIMHDSSMWLNSSNYTLAIANF